MYCKRFLVLSQYFHIQVMTTSHQFFGHLLLEPKNSSLLEILNLSFLKSTSCDQRIGKISELCLGEERKAENLRYGH